MGMLKCKHCHTEFEVKEGDPDDSLKCPHCNGTVLPSETEAELPPGFVLGGFEVVKLLGRGGMGNVYLATQVSMQRHVALKVLPKSLTRDGSSVMKFLNEVKNSGRLQHANIVSAIDAGEDNGTYFLAMQYVPGETLEAKIDRDKVILESDALDYALMIAEALKYAWDRQNIFHKDIKPGNIIIDSASDEAFLLDMGISQKIGETNPEDTHIEGSPFYMSPEQSRGEKLDWKTDIYSLGATLYNAVVGVPPFDDKDVMRIVEMHSTEPFPEPSKLNPESKVTPGVVKLIKKMMSKNPADRHKSWAAFIKECTKIRKELGTRTSKLKLIKARSGGNKSYVMKKAGNPMLIFVNVMLFLALVGVGSFFGYKAVNKSAAKKALEKAEDYISRPGFEYQSAMEFFSDAKDTADRVGVPADVRKRATDGYSAIKSAAERRAAEQEAFDSAMKVATIHFSKAKELNLQAKESMKSKQTDDGILEKAMDEAKKAMNGTTGISSDDTKELQRLEQFKDAIGTLMKQLDAEIARNGKIEAANAAKLREKAQAEENARREAEKKEMEAKSTYATYKIELAKRKEELCTVFVAAGKKRNFDAMRERFAIPKESSTQNDSQSRREALAFNVWLSSTIDKVDRAAKVWSSIEGSGKKFAGKIFTVNGKSCTISSIEKSDILYSNGKEKVAISDLSPSDVLTLAKRLMPQEGSSMDLVSFLIADGDFEEAASCTTDDDVRKEISSFAKAYIKARMQKAIKDSNAGKTGGMERIKQDYGSMTEYSELEKELGVTP